MWILGALAVAGVAAWGYFGGGNRWEIAFLGGFTALVACYLVSYAWSWRLLNRRGQPVEGTIVAKRRRSGGVMGGGTYGATVEYTAPDGTRHTAEVNASKEHKVGESYELRYDPLKPSRAMQWDMGSARWVIFGIFAVFTVGLAALFLFYVLGPVS